MASPAPPRGSAPALAGLFGWRLWTARIGLAAGVPLLLVCLVEGCLRVVGWGYPTSFCILSPDGSAYVENARFLFQFYSRKTNLRPNPFAVAARKPPNALRIVVLGESAAAGTPEPGYSFGRILERMLWNAFPERKIEVLNAAMPGINSHIVRHIARDCARLQPDLFVLYIGNNETVGLYAPGPHSGRLTRWRSLLRIIECVRASRVGQLLEPLLFRLDSDAAPAEQQNDEFFLAHRVAADDPRRAAVYDNFQANLLEICESARRARAGVALVTVPSNLKNCPPLGSLHRGDLSPADLARWDALFGTGTAAEAAARFAEALTNYTAAAVLDNHFADVHFRSGTCALAAARTDAARAGFLQARDWDALQFRADSRMNDVVRRLAQSLAGYPARLVDAEQVFARAEPDRLPGGRFFHDHVHLTFEGNYVLAEALFPVVCQSTGLSVAATNAPIPRPLSREESAARLAFTRVNEGQVIAQMLKTTALPPFTLQSDHGQRQRLAERNMAERFGNVGVADLTAAAEVYSEAMRLAPQDWRLPFQFGQLLLLTGNPASAAEQFRSARSLLPHWTAIRIGLAAALRNAGRRDEALRELQEARSLAPWSDTIQAALRSLH